MAAFSIRYPFMPNPKGHFLLNDSEIHADLSAGSVLLDFVREQQRLTAAKPGCREGDCGACQVLLGAWNGESLRYRTVNSCLLPLADVEGRHVVTLEGLNQPGLSPIQQALLEQGGVQCGYCTAGLVVALTGYLLEAQGLNTDDARDALAGNLCRCTGYAGIRRALATLCAGLELPADTPAGRVERLVELGILPGYFLSIPKRLRQLPATEPSAEASGAVRVGGGTDLFTHDPKQWAGRPLVLLSRHASLQGIWMEAGRLYIGAESTEEDIRSSPLIHAHFPGLKQDFRLIASTPIRHRATLGGNLANASPIADGAVYFLAHNASLGLKQGRQLRELSLGRFFHGYKQVDLREGEEIEWLAIEPPVKPTAFSFEKVSRRAYLDVATVNSALRIEVVEGWVENAWLSAGGVAPVPLLLDQAGASLLGKRLDAAAIKEAARLAQEQAAPIDDIRGSAPYKRLLLRQLVYAHFLKLFPGLIRWEDLS